MSERTIVFLSAEDDRHPDPAENGGLRSAVILFTLKGRKGAVTFELDTRWQLPEVQEEWVAQGRMLQVPTPREVGIHSPVPLHEGQEVTFESCDALDGRPCYYTFSVLDADRAYKKLLREGSGGLWDALESFYIGAFGEESEPEEQNG